jgi:raffinose/stachyose/melibiose transport system permease protein
MAKRDKIGRITGNVLAYFIMGLFTILTVYPIVWLIINSFKSRTEFMINRMGLPIEPTINNFFDAWKLGQFDKLIGNSVFYTVMTTIGIIVFSFMAGFAFAKIPSKATGPLYNSFLIGILLTIQSIMVPLFLMMNSLHLYNTRIGVLIPYIGIGLPLGIYLSTEYVKSIPTALVESARLDGAGYFKIFFAIILPMAMPVAVTLAIMNITATWNEFMLINILASSTEIKSLPLGIYMFSGSLASDFGKQFAALVIGMLPMLLFYIAFQKQITKGVAAGAVKE